MNKVSVVQMSCDKSRCNNCKACAKVCDMAVDPSVNCNHTECIRCGKCKDVCPSKAISYTNIFKG